MKAGVIITTHGELATELRNTCQMLTGTGKHILAICYLPEQSPDILRDNLSLAINNMTDKSLIIVFCDIKGGSPCNVSLQLAKQDQRLTVISGVNVPVLLETLSILESESSENLLMSLHDVLSHSIEILNKE